jgi:hypothetical protein
MIVLLDPLPIDHDEKNTCRYIPTLRLQARNKP